MALTWYLKKEYFDTSDDIADVRIHYLATPLGQEPDWSQATVRSMPAGEVLKTGVGEVAKYGPAAPSVPQHVHPRLRKKVLKLPNEVYDPALGAYTGHYRLHSCYEVLRAGQSQFSPVFSEEIVTREVGLLDSLGIIAGTCVNWSVGDWDAPQFSPTEEVRFAATFGADHPLRQHKFYGTADRDAFAVAKKAFVDRLPLPHRFTVTISAPVGADVKVRYHVGNWGLPEGERWEDYWLDESFVMVPGLAPLVPAPFGTDGRERPLSAVTPELLVGNPYAALLPETRPVVSEPVAGESIVEAARRQVEAIWAAQVAAEEPAAGEPAPARVAPRAVVGVG